MQTGQLPIEPMISVVIPCRNEEANVVAIAAAVIDELERVGEPFDVLFIDNDSIDRTVPLVRGMCALDPRIRLIVNTRNFGQMRSPTHAILQTRGRAVIGLSADFQEPPELIGQFVQRWRAGVDIVLGVAIVNHASAALRISRRLSYALARRFGDYPVIPNATGFGLYDRKVVREIARLKEPEPFFRGMLVETGYRIETIPYVRPLRAGGRSNNNFLALLDFAISSLAGSSKKLLRTPLYMAMFAGLATLLTGVGMLAAAANGSPVLPWLIASAVQFQFALLFTAAGLIGVQVGHISDRTRDTPLVVERERVNFPEGY